MSLGPGELLALAMLGTLAIALFSGVPVAVVIDLLRTERLGANFFRLYGTHHRCRRSCLRSGSAAHHDGRGAA
ncbi:MAG: hypothetical protein ACKVQT_08330 [Burkholderiales bacterium]